MREWLSVCILATVHSVLLGLIDDPEVKSVFCVHAVMFAVQPLKKCRSTPDKNFTKQSFVEVI